ncbi:hypothetical protein EUX98_g5396 [Antrodiella citrinella]|uniref:Transmembrane protein n=1 Tax=Antrodiella citrinella TaxID=2447956 RepID=A0A4S4MZF5_9APHY|nr:hypothetical protein EUX98_g5396 [Antrodiella citrinella]
MRGSTGLVVWGLLVSSRYAFAQDATLTFDVSGLRLRENEGEAHQTIEAVDHPVVVVTVRPKTPSTSPSLAIIRPHSSGTSAHLPISHSHPLPATSHHLTHPSFVPPTETDSPQPGVPDRRPPHPLATAAVSPRHKSISTVSLVFAVLGGIALVLGLLSLIRCLYVYRRTPSRDRIAGLMNRHQLDQEMEEREREQLARRIQERVRPVWKPPPPPYMPAPPAYDIVGDTDAEPAAHSSVDPHRDADDRP